MEVTSLSKQFEMITLANKYDDNCILYILPKDVLKIILKYMKLSETNRKKIGEYIKNTNFALRSLLNYEFYSSCS